MKNKVFGLAGILCLILLVPSYLSADLGSYEYRIIKIAFMNGYVRALSADVETIKSLKENEEYLQRVVSAQTNHYMQEVSHLNHGVTVRQVIENPGIGEPSKAFQRNTTW